MSHKFAVEEKEAFLEMLSHKAFCAIQSHHADMLLLIEEASGSFSERSYALLNSLGSVGEGAPQGALPVLLGETDEGIETVSLVGWSLWQIVAANPGRFRHLVEYILRFRTADNPLFPELFGGILNFLPPPLPAEAARLLDDLAARPEPAMRSIAAWSLTSIDYVEPAKAARCIEAFSKDKSPAVRLSLLGSLQKSPCMAAQHWDVSKARLRGLVHDEELRIQDEAIRLFAAMDECPRIRFEDIVNLDDGAMRILIRELCADKIAAALMLGAGQAVERKFLGNMSQGARTLVKETLEYLRKPSPAQCERTKAEIVSKAARIMAGR